MPGNVRDLSTPDLALPAILVLDSSIVINWLTAVGWRVASVPTSPQQIGAARLVAHLAGSKRIGLVTPTALNEIFHFVLKTGFRAALPHHQADLIARYPRVRRHEWYHLFKARCDLIVPIVADLDQTRRLMLGNRLLVLQPEDLGPIPSGRPLEDELVRTMERYELDSSDAAILIEARRAGITDIATADPDLRRAGLDFDVYTWL